MIQLTRCVKCHINQEHDVFEESFIFICSVHHVLPELIPLTSLNQSDFVQKQQFVHEKITPSAYRKFRALCSSLC